MQPIKLWKDNKTDAEWSIELEDFIAEFIEYDNRHKLSEGWPLERCIRSFITSNKEDGGLQSVFEEGDYELMHDACRAARWPKESRL